MKSFNERCYDILRKVPKGRVTTYKAIARKLNTKAYRAVGNAMNKNPYAYAAWGRAGGEDLAKQSLLVPCHRVVGSKGDLTGFASGLKAKTKMLEAEGVQVRDNKVNLEKYEHDL